MQLEGELVPTGKTGIAVFDDPNSFTLNIHSAEMSMSVDALANALNQYAFAAADAPIKGIRISLHGGKRVSAVFPTVTNTNNASTCCGTWPKEDGITGNSYFNEQTAKPITWR